MKNPLPVNALAFILLVTGSFIADFFITSFISPIVIWAMFNLISIAVAAWAIRLVNIRQKNSGRSGFSWSRLFSFFIMAIAIVQLLQIFLLY